MFGIRKLKKEIEYLKGVNEAQSEKITELAQDISDLLSGDIKREFAVKARYDLLKRIEKSIWHGE